MKAKAGIIPGTTKRGFLIKLPRSARRHKIVFSATISGFWAGGKYVELTPAMGRMFCLLFNNLGRPVSKARMMEAATLNTHTQTRDAFAVALYELRKRLQQSAYTVQVVRGFGYMLHIDSAVKK